MGAFALGKLEPRDGMVALVAPAAAAVVQVGADVGADAGGDGAVGGERGGRRARWGS